MLELFKEDRLTYHQIAEQAMADHVTKINEDFSDSDIELSF